MEIFASNIVSNIVSNITKNFTFSKINPTVPLDNFDDLFFKTKYSKDELLSKRIEYLFQYIFGYDDDILVKIVIDSNAIFYKKGKYYYIPIKDILITCVILEKSNYSTRYDKHYIESGRSLDQVFLNFKNYKYHEDIFYTFDTILMQLLRGICSTVPYRKFIKLSY